MAWSKIIYGSVTFQIFVQWFLYYTEEKPYAQKRRRVLQIQNVLEMKRSKIECFYRASKKKKVRRNLKTRSDEHAFELAYIENNIYLFFEYIFFQFWVSYILLCLILYLEQ